MSSDEAWIELREPQRVPERKGPFHTPRQLKDFLIELLDVRPAALVTVMRVCPSGPDFQDGPEALEMMDGRYRSRAARHRESSRLAWKAL